MAKYLVTGGAGFIGANLTELLLKEGHEVTVFDNYYGGKFSERVQKDAIYIEGDIRDKTQLFKIMDSKDGVFHLAAVPRMPYSIENPWETHDVNVNGTLQVLLCAKEAKVKRVVYSASSSAYGNQDAYPYSENLKPKPLSPYGVQKMVGEEYCRVFSEIYGLETVSLRYFNVYGKYLSSTGSYASVIAKFLEQKKGKKPMSVCGDGEYLRDFTHVSDVIKANFLAMTSVNVGKGEVLNIGCSHARTVNELVKIIGGDYIYVPSRQGDPKRSQADITLAKKMLNWEPQVSLEEGILDLKKYLNIE